MSRRLIVLAEDEPVVLRSLLRLLQSQGHNVHTAINGEMAEAVFQQERMAGRKPLLITDKDMPVKNGMELSRDVRKAYPDAPIIMLAAIPEEEKNAALASGDIDEFLAKPVNPAALTQAMDRVAKKHNVPPFTPPGPSIP